MTSSSARYTYIPGDTGVARLTGMGRLIDQVNEFCRKYPEYRLMQVVTERDRQNTSTMLYAILTTDPS